MSNLVVYEDDNIIICNKPVGMASQSERSFETDLVSEMLKYRVAKGEEAYVAIINRLDKPVGGLVLFAKDKKTAASLSAMSGEHSIEKYYYAVVEGVVDDKGELLDFLLKNPKENVSRVVSKETTGAKKARLLYERVGIKNIDGKDYSIVKVRLLTGRHHQIRLQFSHAGHPLYGDMKYNKEFVNKRGVFPALFAYHLSFKNPAGIDLITVEVEPKEEIFKV